MAFARHEGENLQIIRDSVNLENWENNRTDKFGSVNTDVTHFVGRKADSVARNIEICISVGVVYIAFSHVLFHLSLIALLKTRGF